jgi:hypothetical protein
MLEYFREFFSFYLLDILILCVRCFVVFLLPWVLPAVICILIASMIDNSARYVAVGVLITIVIGGLLFANSIRMASRVWPEGPCSGLFKDK